MAGTLTSIMARGGLYEVTITMKAGTAGFKPTALARLWADKAE
jgi:hypothetical protein